MTKPVQARTGMGANALLQLPGVKKLLGVLNPQPDCTRLVGGAVRDALLGLPVKDIDLATRLSPQQVMDLCARENLQCVPTGLEFGTVTVVLDKRGYEVTTLREDIETDGRHAVVKFGTDWAKDAARRDFTLNALYLDSGGNVHAPAGGLEDLEGRKVRFIGDAGQRIREDYLRIWRFFRFSAFYAGTFDAEGLAACIAGRSGLALLSAERVKQELFKVLAAPQARTAITLMSDAGLIASLLGVPLLGRFAFFDGGFTPLQKLGALFLHVREDAERLAKALRLSNAEKEELRQIAAVLEHLRAAHDERKARELLYRFPQGLRPAAKILGLAQFADLASPPAFPLKGSDLLAQGFSPGPQLGETLKKLEMLWIESDFTLTGEDLLARARG